MMRLRVKNKASRLTTDAILLSLSLILSYIEALILPLLPIPLPGIKIGLANIIVVFMFFSVGKADSLIVMLLRVLISSLLFGSVTGLFFSLGGGLLSYLFLCLSGTVLKKHFTFIGISVGCAALHNVGQIIVAALLFGKSAFVYLPVLLIVSMLTGGLNGIIITFLSGRIINEA